MVEVEQWAEVRRMHFGERVPIEGTARRTGRSRVTIRRALRSKRPPRYSRPAMAYKLDAHREEIHRLLCAEPGMRRRGSAS